MRFLRLIRDGFTEAGQAQVLTTLLTVDALKGYDATTLIRFGAGLYAPDHKECRERVEAAFSLKTPLDQINGLLRVAYNGHLSVGTIAYFENLVDKTEQLIQIRAGIQKLTDIKFDPNAAFIIDTICRPPPSNAMQTGALASVYEMIERHVDPGTLKNAFRMKRRALPADQRATVNQHFNAAKKAFLPLRRAVGNVYLPMRIAGYAGRAVAAVIPSRLLPKPGLGGG